MDYYLSRYKEKYKLCAEIDTCKNDYPREIKHVGKDGTTKEELCYNDIYIDCKKGRKIWHIGSSTLQCYIPRLKKGRSILNDIQSNNIKCWDIEENDIEMLFKFNSKDIEIVATIMEARPSPKKNSPFSTSNLPKAKKSECDIPIEKLKLYSEIISVVPKTEKLVIGRITTSFLTDILAKKYKAIDIKADMKLKMMARKKNKEYIYSMNMWDEYLKYLKNNLMNYK